MIPNALRQSTGYKPDGSIPLVPWVFQKIPQAAENLFLVSDLYPKWERVSNMEMVCQVYGKG